MYFFVSLCDYITAIAIRWTRSIETYYKTKIGNPWGELAVIVAVIYQSSKGSDMQSFRQRVYNIGFEKKKKKKVLLEIW